MLECVFRPCVVCGALTMTLVETVERDEPVVCSDCSKKQRGVAPSSMSVAKPDAEPRS